MSFEDRGYDGSHGQENNNDWNDQSNGGGYAAAAQQHQAAQTAGQVGVDERMAFIRRTYAHLAGAVGAFIALEVLLFASGAFKAILPLMIGYKYSWAVVLALFIGGGMLAERWALNTESTAMQYIGLGAYTALWAVIFVPLIFMAQKMSPGAIPSAAGVTLLVFGGLTAFVFTTKQDFSFLRTALVVASLLAFGGIAASIFLGFHLGIWFSVFMVGLASISILYNTSNVLHHYRTDQHVGAALGLFSSVALLFWYVLSIFMGE